MLEIERNKIPSPKNKLETAEIADSRRDACTLILPIKIELTMVNSNIPVKACHPIKIPNAAPEKPISESMWDKNDMLRPTT